MATRAQAKAMLRLFERRLLSYPNVVSVGIGRKNGKGDEGWCIRVHVTRKTTRFGTTSVPKILRPPRNRNWLKPIKTDVEQVGAITLHAEFSGSAGAGIVTQSNRGTCTAAFVSPNNVFFVLTCGHVMNSDLPGLHEFPSGNLPASAQVRCNELSVPETEQRLFGKCVRCSSQSLPIDVALIELDGSVAAAPSQYLRGIRNTTQNPIKAGETLRILRRYSHGRIYTVRVPPEHDHEVTTTFGYRTRLGIKNVQYTGLLVYPARSGADALQAGDSGSAVFDASGLLVGIHLGASTDPQKPIGYAISGAQVVAWAPTLKLFAR